MNKIAVIVLADTTTPEGLGRMANALEVVKEFKDSGDTVQLIFDGAATRWLAELVKPDHMLHSLYQTVEDTIAGACGFCAGAFDMEDVAASYGIPLLTEFDSHPSIRKLVYEGYTVLNY